MSDDAVESRAERSEAAPVGVRFEPDIVLPVQLLGRGPAALQPEKRLMLAVLEDAVATVSAQRRGRDRQALAEVEAWFASTDDQSPFAFVRVCDALGIDPVRFRGGLARVREAEEGDAAARYRAFRRIAGARNSIGG